MGRPKLFKKLPEENFFFGSQIIEKDLKKYLYLGTSDVISENKGAIYTGKNSVPVLITNSNNKHIICKIGITKNLEQRLSYFNKDIPDFKFIKIWRINNPATLESRIIGDHYKDDISTFGKEWIWLTEEQKDQIIEEIEWYIENSYTKYRNGYTYLFKRN